MQKFCGFLLFLLSVFAVQGVMAQSDTLFFHNGKTAIGKVISVSGYTVSYVYQGEETIQMISKYALHRIHYRSGRTEPISEKIQVNGEEDWDKVIVLEDKEQNAGLVRASDIRAHTSFINLHTANSGEAKVSASLLREAAKRKCPFILISFERVTVYNGLIKSWGALQEIKKATSYHY